MSRDKKWKDRSLEVLTQIFSTNQEDISTWFSLYAPSLIGTFIFLGGIVILARFGSGDRSFEFNLIASFASFLFSISGVLQILRKASPGGNFRIIRGTKAKFIGSIWFIISLGLSLYFLYQALY